LTNLQLWFQNLSFLDQLTHHSGVLGLYEGPGRSVHFEVEATGVAEVVPASIPDSGSVLSSPEDLIKKGDFAML
jgi:hypothetical protein